MHAKFSVWHIVLYCIYICCISLVSLNILCTFQFTPSINSLIVFPRTYLPHQKSHGPKDNMGIKHSSLLFLHGFVEWYPRFTNHLKEIREANKATSRIMETSNVKVNFLINLCDWKTFVCSEDVIFGGRRFPCFPSISHVLKGPLHVCWGCIKIQCLVLHFHHFDLF